MKFLVFILMLGLSTSCILTGKSKQYEEYSLMNPAKSNDSLATFIFHDLNSINLQTMQTYALPWKMVVTAMAMNQADKEEVSFTKIQKVLQSYGFVFPKKLYGWKDNEFYPTSPYIPAGIVTGFMESRSYGLKMEISNIGCATCHGGINYDAQGEPNFEFVAGRANTSIQLERFYNDIVRSLYRLKDKKFKKEFFRNILKLFPKITKKEYISFKVLIPLTTSKVGKMLKKFGRATPYEIGEIGTTNGLASIKRMLKVQKYTHFSDETNLVSIPSLSNRGFRSSLLVDGSYRHRLGPGRYVEIHKDDINQEHLNQLTEVASFFTVGTQGQKPKRAVKNAKLLHKVGKFLWDFKGTPFPGKINNQLALKGSRVYENKCSHCHGTYSEGIKPELLSFPNKFISADKIKTDAVRVDIQDLDRLLKKFNETKFSEFIEGESNKGYVAPLLGGVWATAPYLHNGSVPTLWHLMHPEARPDRFPVGGHSLDFDKVGVRYIEGTTDYGYKPWATPGVYETAKKGHSNKGHERVFKKMSEDDKASLLEYLKLL